MTVGNQFSPMKNPGRNLFQATADFSTVRYLSFVCSWLFPRCLKLFPWEISCIRCFSSQFGSSCPPREWPLLISFCIPFCPKFSSMFSFYVMRCLDGVRDGSLWTGFAVHIILFLSKPHPYFPIDYNKSQLSIGSYLAEKCDFYVYWGLKLHCEHLAEYL